MHILKYTHTILPLLQQTHKNLAIVLHRMPFLSYHSAHVWSLGLPSRAPREPDWLGLKSLHKKMRVDAGVGASSFTYILMSVGFEMVTFQSLSCSLLYPPYHHSPMTNICTYWLVNICDFLIVRIYPSFSPDTLLQTCISMCISVLVDTIYIDFNCYFYCECIYSICDLLGMLLLVHKAMISHKMSVMVVNMTCGGCMSLLAE